MTPNANLGIDVKETAPGSAVAAMSAVAASV
jgi:hypothetical protein